MANIDNAISDALGLTKNIKEQILDPKPIIPRPQQAIVPSTEHTEDIDSDYKYSRENFYNLIERGQDAITGILDLAEEQEHPRTYEVAGQLIKTVVGKEIVCSKRWGTPLATSLVIMNWVHLAAPCIGDDHT